MRDLELGRRIDAGTVTADELRQLAILPLTARAPLFRGVLALLGQDLGGDVRAAALGLLVDARGMAAMRSVVAHLNDDDERVRMAALETLRVTARNAPVRFSHALFHPRDDIRRAALSGPLPVNTGEIATYLRADPVCRDLAHELLWPEPRFPLALDLHRMGALSDRGLLDQLLQATPAQLREALERDYTRNKLHVGEYLQRVATGAPLAVAQGFDVLDAVIDAIATLGAWGKELAAVILAVTRARAKARPAKDAKEDDEAERGVAADALTRRTLVAVLSRLARDPHPQLWSAAVTLDPELLTRAPTDEACRSHIANGLFHYAWPVRVARDRVLALLALPHVTADLALAAAVAGWLPHEADAPQQELPGVGLKKREAMSRLQAISTVIGDERVLELLRASTRGWKGLCRLPQESSATELRWLAQIRRWDPKHAAVLEGLALSVWRRGRLDAFITKIPEAQRPAALYSLLMHADLDAGDLHLLTVSTMFATRMDAVGFADLLSTLLEPGENARARTSVLTILRSLTDKVVASTAKRLADDQLARLVAHIDSLAEQDALPRSVEIALASVAADRTDALEAWAKAITAPASTAAVIVLPPNRAQRTLADGERASIATAPDDSLLAALGASVFTPTVGLVDALGRRHPMRSISACCALLGAADPLPDVATQLDRFAEFSPKFDGDLDDTAARAWGSATQTAPPLVHARLWRWEAHTEYLATWIASAGGVFRALQAVDALDGRLAQQTMWRGIAEVLVFLRYRDKPRYTAEASTELATFAAERIAAPWGLQAARVVVALVEGGAVPINEVRSILLAQTPEASADARDQLARLIRMDGMPTPPPVTEVLAPSAMLERIRASRDLDALEKWCEDSRSGVAQEAALAMASLGAEGQQRLARMLPRIGDFLAPVAILSTIALWDDAQAIAAASELAARSDLAPEWQFHLCVGIGDFARAIQAVHALPSMTFKRANWDALADLRTPLEVAFHLVDAPQHHAYWPSIELLLKESLSSGVRDGLVRFLEVDQARPLHLRRDAAERLMVIDGDPRGISILVEKMIEGQNDNKELLTALPSRMHDMLAEAFVDVALIAGHGACSEKKMIALLDEIRPHRKLDPDVDGHLATRMLDEAQTKAGRKYGAIRAVSDREVHSRMRAVAEVFAWGVRRGVELTGRLMRFHLTSEQKDLGYTFLTGNQIYVSALPMLRGEPNGVDVVEGLVLHELGHHVYHRGEEPEAIWKRAHAEGLGHLLNLIADEHLERNLRGVEPEYGDRLKRLGAYAFQHAPQEMKVTSLLQSLRGSSARALIGTELEVAFDEESVRLRRGAILSQLEKHGHPLARFSRALRMNLGNRYADPLVAAALDLIPKDLKRLSMMEMYELTKKLAEMFGGATACAKVFGGAEGLEFGERDDDVFSGGVDDAILQKEVERILDPNQAKGSGKKAPDRLAINVNPDEQFAHIMDVRRVQGDKGKHRELVTEVARHSTRLRQHLDDLGLRWLPVKARTKGHALDRGRLRPLITHGDPRILQARTPIRRTDLFLGTLIDCSGSMQAGQNIERAKKFAVLIAEAVRDLPGVDARFFGFTDTVIFDAGDARTCEVTALAADGGNNDAAALYHVASVAASSQKRARVLVMISDGLPTQCSVAALRGLVTTLTKRKGMVCAQVAVRKLEEECFPHHVLLDDAQVDTAVAKFGRMIGDLTRRALGS
ncbi:MAG TPA: vWA domain-containing protein [Kofleriaceae bacterium]